MKISADVDVLGPWAWKLMGSGTWFSSDKSAIGELNDDGSPRWAAIYDNYEPNGSIQIHTAIDNPKYVTRQALRAVFEYPFYQLGVKKVLAHIESQTNLKFAIDEKALDDIGLGTDSPITIDVTGVSVDSGLALILRPLDLTWTVKKGGVRITTPEAAEAGLELRSYRAHGLAPGGDVSILVNVITSTVAPATWSSVGGPGSIRRGAIAGEIQISQTSQIHVRIAKLIGELKAANR